MSAAAFLDRVMPNVPSLGGRDFQFKGWRHAGRPTQEGVGVLAQSGVNVDKLAACIMNVNSYRGNVDHVEESRSIADSRYATSQAVRFYQRVKVPMLATIHMELVLQDFGMRDGWRVMAWDQLGPETDRLSAKLGARSEYNVGAWLIKTDVVAYALSSSPRKKDVGRLKFAALTRGADAGASQVLKANIRGMVAWSKRA